MLEMEYDSFCDVFYPMCSLTCARRFSIDPDPDPSSWYTYDKFNWSKIDWLLPTSMNKPEIERTVQDSESKLL